jgi:hypothetical protein
MHPLRRPARATAATRATWPSSTASCSRPPSRRSLTVLRTAP